MDKKKPEVVTERASTPRSYVVVTQDGNPIPNPEKSSKSGVPGTDTETGAPS